MKRKIIIFIVFILVAAAITASYCCFAKNDSEVLNNELKKIKKETQQCLDTSDGGIGAGNCEYDALEKYKTLVNKTVKKLENTLPKDKHQNFTTAQKTWETYVNQYFDSLDETINHSPPYYAYIICAQIKAETYKARAESLIEMYDMYLYLKEEEIVK